MSARKKAKELYDISNVTNTPIHWHIWKIAFDAGFMYAKEQFIMSEDDAKIFCDVLENPPEPNEALKAAFNRYNEKFKSSE